MQAPVVVQDHAVRLPLGGQKMRVLSVSGAVRQCRAKNKAGQATDDAGGIWDRREEAGGEEATGAGKGSGRQVASKGGGEGNTRGDERTRLGMTAHPEATRATRYGGKRDEEGRR